MLTVEFNVNNGLDFLIIEFIPILFGSCSSLSLVSEPPPPPPPHPPPPPLLLLLQYLIFVIHKRV